MQVLRLGSALRVRAVPLVGVDPEGPSPPDAAPRIRALPSPVRGGCPVTLEWPRAGERSVELFDLAGRRVRTLFHGPVEAGREVQRVDLGGVPAGIFVLRARQGSASAARRFVILP